MLITAPPPPPPHLPPQRLEELHAKQQTDGRLSARYPAGSLVYWVLWDVFAFVFGWAVTLPFLLSELGHVQSFDDLLLDWRLRCALYFCKVH